MHALIQAVYNAVMEFYDHGKPWKEDFVKFTIEFDEQGRVAAITHTPFPAEHRDALFGARQRRLSAVWEELNRRVGQRGLWDLRTRTGTNRAFVCSIHLTL